MRRREAGDQRGLGTVTEPLTPTSSARRAGAQGDDEYDVIGADGLVIGAF